MASTVQSTVQWWCSHGTVHHKGNGEQEPEAGDEAVAVAPGLLAAAWSVCFLFSSVFSLWVWVYAHRGQKWVSHPLELEFETTVSYHVGCLELNPHPLEEQSNPQFAFL